jgi:hypothetical protein
MESVSQTAEHPRSRPPSVARVIFSYAYNRIWTGRLLPASETILWSIVAVYAGFAYFELTSSNTDFFIEKASLYGLLIATPLIAGYAIMRGHVNVGMADESLRNVPLTPSQVLFPRFLAAMLTWLQIAGPFVIAYVVYTVIAALTYGFNNEFPSMNIILPLVKLFLSTDVLSEFRDGSPVPVPFEETILYVLVFFQIIGYGALPVSWGMWWGTRFQHRGGPFLLAFFSYVILPVGLYFFIRQDYLGLFLPRPLEYWAIVLLTGLSGIVLSIIFFALACRDWARRSG